MPAIWKIEVVQRLELKNNSGRCFFIIKFLGGIGHGRYSNMAREAIDRLKGVCC